MLSETIFFDVETFTVPSAPFPIFMLPAGSIKVLDVEAVEFP
jgi:hypothetical protein